MTPRERTRALRENGRADRLPWQMFGVWRCMGSPELMPQGQDIECRVELELLAYQRFGFDGVGIGPGMFGIAEAAGSRMRYGTGKPALLEQPLLADAQDLGRIDSSGLLAKGRIPECLAGLERLQQAVGAECPVSSNLAGPVTTAAGLCGPKQLSSLMREQPEQALALIDCACDLLLHYCDALIERGIAPTLADPFASGSVLSVAQFKRFALPALKRCFTAIEERSGQRAVLHLCGTSRPIWPLLRQLPLGGLSLDNKEDLAAACQAFSGHCALFGNLPPVELLAEGSQAAIEQAVARTVAVAGGHPDGFVLAPGCSLRANTPLVHLDWVHQTLVRASQQRWV